jgi:hypothetical protein
MKAEIIVVSNKKGILLIPDDDIESKVINEVLDSVVKQTFTVDEIREGASIGGVPIKPGVLIQSSNEK